MRTVSNGMTDRSCCVANWALVLVQDGASDTAIVILAVSCDLIPDIPLTIKCEIIKKKWKLKNKKPIKV